MNLHQGGGTGIDGRYPAYQGGQQQQQQTGGYLGGNGAGGSAMQGISGVGLGNALHHTRGQVPPPGIQSSMASARAGASSGIPGSMVQQQHLQQSAGGRVGQQGSQQPYGGATSVGGQLGNGVQQTRAVPGAGQTAGFTSPQSVARPQGMQGAINFHQSSNAMQQQGGYGGRSAVPGTTGGSYVPPSGDLLSMLNNKGNMGMNQTREDGPAFSLSDFPTLGGTQGNSVNAQGRAQEAAAPDALGALLGSQKRISQSPAFGEEDFPALPGAPAPNRRMVAQSVAQPQQQRAATTIRPTMQQSNANPPQPATATKLPAGMMIGRKGMQGPQDYGLLGLLNVIRMTDPDLTTLALGTDLTTLGLNLNSPELLWKTFSSPWADGPAKQEVDPRIPECYLAPPTLLRPEHLAHFKLDTLFYLFYGLPGDESQLRAARELANRGWMYHKDLKSWLTRAPNTEPLQKSDRSEVGSYLIFDVSSWEVVRKDNYALTFDSIVDPPNLSKLNTQTV